MNRRARHERHVVSIRTRLLLLLVGATALCWLVAIAWSYLDARRDLAELFDAQLAQAGRMVLERAGDVEEMREHARKDRVETLPERDHLYEESLHFQVWSDGGRQLYQSSPELPHEPIVPLGSRGFFDRTLHGTRWRVLVLADSKEQIEVQICQRADLRASLAASVARNMLVPVATVLPVLALLIWFATTAGIRPLQRFAAELSGRRPDDVAPLAGEPRPSELTPLAQALDGLLERLRRRLELERSFTADAAHELRTPLAALKTQAQVALRARSTQERTHALGQVVRGTDRMTHLVRQLLTLARLEPDAAEGFAAVDLAEVADEVLTELAAEARQRGVCLRRAGAAEMTVFGNRPLLATLVGNLVENSIRHGVEGGEARVEVDRVAGRAVLRVVDDGPGIPDAERERVFDRFHRVVGRGGGGGSGGSGLGLSIVARIAELHGATITLGTRPRGDGFEVTVEFPTVTSPRRSDLGTNPNQRSAAADLRDDSFASRMSMIKEVGDCRARRRSS
ncbi:MAG: ATP-binding protein [Thermoanaerobaculia bacterium]